uniref:myoferlin isoform X2 n=1 Tax=Ciona intestinalis TaxID=7719 RepID=UPI000EF44CFA|nr:myoferlin isoform X2 [Ciona intestinalis]|eukprot:XP_026691852.1 myoferlin isoform X2 [Ciona intestinalis]
MAEDSDEKLDIKQTPKRRLSGLFSLKKEDENVSVVPKSDSEDEGVGNEVEPTKEGNDVSIPTFTPTNTRVDRSALSEKPEDFQIRLKVICGRQLAGSNIKPVVTVKAGKTQTKITRIRKGSAPIWNEMFLFTFKESLKELCDYIFEFTVNNSRNMRSDGLIGTFKLDVGSIYNQPEHAYVKKWLLLTDPDDNSNSTQGYLKITICVLGAGDQPPDETEDIAEEDDVDGNLLTPAGASMRSAYFTLRVYGAEDLPQMDLAFFENIKQKLGLTNDENIAKSLVDPYLKFKFAGKKVKTKVLLKTNHPEWNEELSLSLKFPSMCDTVQLILIDWDRIGADDIIGTVTIPLSRISSTGDGKSGGFLPTFGPSYINFYGSPREFSETGDVLEDLNKGKGDGCAYRGRAMVELVTTMDEEGVEPPPPTQPIADEQVAVMQKHLRRRRYRLVVGFESASLMRKPLEKIEFEVSMGNNGNKFDTEIFAPFSVTHHGNSVFDGVHYHYMPWASEKPITIVTSHWEDISSRLYAMNFILKICDQVRDKMNQLKVNVENKSDPIDIAAEIVSILDILILETSKKLPNPHGKSSNQLDRKIYHQRKGTLLTICQEAKELRQNCTEANEAIEAISNFLEILEQISYEPQNSLPDVVIWMISDDKRVAYARIPAYDVLYSPDKQEFCGRFCSEPQTVTLKYPTTNVRSKKQYKVPAQVRLIAWLGRAVDQDHFKFNSNGQISVFAETFEAEVKIPLVGWSSKGYTDISGELPLPKDAFSCPTDWKWEEDWKIDSIHLQGHDVTQGHKSVLEDAYEYEKRSSDMTWAMDKLTSGRHGDVAKLSDLKIPKGWEWDNEWKVDTNRACDEDGWEYRIEETIVNSAWSTMEKTYHTSRRRRLIRHRVCVDEKMFKKAEKEELRLAEGWEYATTMGGQFHNIPRMLDLVRRRRWVRRMVTTGTKQSAAIFNLDASIVKIDDSKTKTDSESESVTDSVKTETTDVETKDEIDDMEQLKEVPEDTNLDSKTSRAEVVSILEADDKPGQLPEKEKVQQKKLKKKKIKKKKSGLSDIFGVSSLATDTLKPKSSSKIPPKIYMVYEKVHHLHLRAYIYQGRDLQPMDQDSFSDSKVIVSFLSQTLKTEVYKHSLNPTWDQTLMMDMKYYGDFEHWNRNCPNISIELYDQDYMGSLVFMGRTIAKPVLKFHPEEKKTTKLEWFNLKKNNQNVGSLLSAFEKQDDREMPLPPPLKPNTDIPMVPCGIRPVLQRTAVEILVWGVREMKSFKLLAVDNPSVMIQIGEVELRTKVMKNFKHNPNFEEPVYYIEANLPVEDLYFPPIVIRVKDHRKFGSRPTVGQHIITDNIKYRLEPTQKESGNDEGYDEMENLSHDVAIEVEHPSNNLQLGFLSKLPSFSSEKKIRDEEIDWWSRFYASSGDTGLCGNYLETGLDLIKIYKDELEKQEDFNYFSDFVQKFRLFRGKVDEDEEREFAGEFKGSFRIYKVPEDLREERPPRCFTNVPPSHAVEVRVRIYVVRAMDLAPKDSNGLADPYIKIKVNKKRIVDRENYVPNTLYPTFGRMFELDLKLPMEKDLHVEVFDWDLIGSDEKIGETVIDLEDRYLSKYKAWCGLPQTYCNSGHCQWRDQMKPKEWLEQKCREQCWDDPVWNGNTCVMVAGKTYKLEDYERGKKPCENWGPADERLALYVLRSFPHVSEHVETRPLFYDGLPNIEQGRLQMWVDMFPKEFGDPGLPYNIEPRKPSKYFLRMIVWNCTDIPMMDVSILGDKMTDIYLKGWLSGLEGKQQKTDVHYRSLDGSGNFNWRFVFPFDYLPQERMVHVSKKRHLWSLDKTVTKFPPVLNIQVWDNDLFGPNEYISEIVLPLTHAPKCCKFNKTCTLENVPDEQGNCRMDMVNLFEQNSQIKGWWPLYRMVDGVKEQAGKLEMSVEILTSEEEEEKPSGQGRDEPNMHPKLEKPNRPATSFAWFSSPFKSLYYIIWRKYKWFIIGGLVALLFAAFLVMFLYSFPNQLTKKLTKTR